ncbi:class I SAM-dependent methyltransferase [bacterium]|nr:class I SAM-dependent methyltransferase [bacterium]
MPSARRLPLLSAEALSARLEHALPRLRSTELSQLTAYLRLVSEYSAVLNLTGFSSADELADGLVVPAVRLLELGEIPAGCLAVDLGSGNGSPVVPLAVLCPQASFTAVEARARRAAFLRQAAAALHLANLTVRHTRIEDMLDVEARSYDLVTARAYARPEQFLKQAAALLAAEGEVRGYAGAEMDEVRSAATKHGFHIHRETLCGGGKNTYHVYSLVRKGSDD